MALDLLPSWLGQSAFGAIMAAAGWLAARKITRAPKREDAEQISRIAAMVEALRRTGLTADQARRLADELGAGHALSDDTLAVILGDATLPKAEVSSLSILGETEPEDDFRLNTTVALQYRLDARVNVLNAQMAEQLAQLELLLSGAAFNGLLAVQDAWNKFRTEEMQFAAMLWGEGTGQTAASLAAEIAIIEARLAELKSLVAQALTH